MTAPEAPGDDYDAALGGEVSTISDEEWLAHHRALIASGAIPQDELGYLYDPDRDPATVTVDELSIAVDLKEPTDG